MVVPSPQVGWCPALAGEKVRMESYRSAYPCCVGAFFSSLPFLLPGEIQAAGRRRANAMVHIAEAGAWLSCAGGEAEGKKKKRRQAACGASCLRHRFNRRCKVQVGFRFKPLRGLGLVSRGWCSLGRRVDGGSQAARQSSPAKERLCQVRRLGLHGR